MWRWHEPKGEPPNRRPIALSRHHCAKTTLINIIYKEREEKKKRNPRLEFPSEIYSLTVRAATPGEWWESFL